jgi:hypothetical protein
MRDENKDRWNDSQGYQECQGDEVDLEILPFESFRLFLDMSSEDASWPVS